MPGHPTHTTESLGGAESGREKTTEVRSQREGLVLVYVKCPVRPGVSVLSRPSLLSLQNK